MSTDGGTSDLAVKFARLSGRAPAATAVTGAVTDAIKGAVQDATENAVEDITTQRLVELTAQSVNETTSAGVVVVRPDATLETRACTDSVVRAVNDAQSRLREGPCLTVAEHCGNTILRIDTVLRIDDMTAEQRWPRFAAEAGFNCIPRHPAALTRPRPSRPRSARRTARSRSIRVR